MATEARFIRLLIVDDEPAIRAGLADLFPWTDWGFTVAGQADNGKKALAWVLAGACDAVLADIRMPEMDGVAFARHLYEASIRVPVVFLSAFADFELGQQAIAYGVRDFLVKPVRLHQLREAMAHVAALCRADEGPQPDLLAAVDAYLDAHLKNATPKGAAAAAGVSEAALRRAYRDRGASYAGALHAARMREAARLVRSIDMKLYEVAARLGYDNAKNFTRAFRAYYGLPPSEYRGDAGG